MIERGAAEIASVQGKEKVEPAPPRRGGKRNHFAVVLLVVCQSILGRVTRMKTLKAGITSKKQPLPFYPNRKGVYVLTNSSGQVLYVGRSKQLCRRASHLTAMQRDGTNPQGLSHIIAGLVRKLQEQGQAVFIQFIETDDDHATEIKLIREYDPPLNFNR